MNEQRLPADPDATNQSDEPFDKPVGEQIGAAPEHVRVPPMPATGPTEIGGPGGLEPTRYGDWERNGRCFDF